MEQSNNPNWNWKEFIKDFEPLTETEMKGMVIYDEVVNMEDIDWSVIMERINKKVNKNE